MIFSSAFLFLLPLSLNNPKLAGTFQKGRRQPLFRELPNPFLVDELDLSPPKCSNAQQLFGPSEVPIYVITQSPGHFQQIIQVVRLAQTVAVLQNIHLILVDNAKEKNQIIEETLQGAFEHARRTFDDRTNDKSFVPAAYTYVSLFKEGSTNDFCRMAQRRDFGMQVLFDRIINSNWPHGVLYFADQSISYTWEAFERMRKITHAQEIALNCLARPLSETFFEGCRAFFLGTSNIHRKPFEDSLVAVHTTFMMETANAAGEQNVTNFWRMTEEDSENSCKWTTSTLAKRCEPHLMAAEEVTAGWLSPLASFGLNPRAVAWGHRAARRKSKHLLAHFGRYKFMPPELRRALETN